VRLDDPLGNRQSEARFLRSGLLDPRCQLPTPDSQDVLTRVGNPDVPMEFA
jgi:hypothetical protein